MIHLSPRPTIDPQVGIRFGGGLVEVDLTITLAGVTDERPTP